MAWLPIGPDSVFAPRATPFRRQSRRNEYGRQGLVADISIDPTQPARIYVTERPSSGGVAIFRTDDDGRSWVPIGDALLATDPVAQPLCLAVHPVHPDRVYAGGLAGIWVSTNRGEPGSWSPRVPVPGVTRKIVIDSRTAADPFTTVLYAAGDNGIRRSDDGGATWPTQVLAGDVRSFQAHMPASGTAHFYAGVMGVGVFHANDPSTAAGWTNLTAAGIGLPGLGADDVALVDFCRLAPTRAYAWIGTYGVTHSFWTTSAPTTSWTQVTATSPPVPGQGLYSVGLAVAPNSPGNGTSDILLFPGLFMSRSIDGGQTWVSESNPFHADQHSIAFFPEYPTGGAIPATYGGSDGGIAKSTRFADPSWAVQTPPPHHNEGDQVADTGTWQNLNHGKQSSAVYQYATVPGAESISYIGCQDTGIAGGTGSLVWRGIADADGGAVAAALAPDGVALWGSFGMFGDWPGFRIYRFLDQGPDGQIWVAPALGASLLGGTSNYVTGLDGKCLAGVVVRDTTTTLAAAVTASAAAQTATPASMSKIVVGSRLMIDDATANAETVIVTATTATTFTATFTKAHASGAPVLWERNLVVRIAPDATVTQISQDFVADGQVSVVVASPVDGDTLYCAVNGYVFTTASGASASAATVWTEVTASKPPIGTVLSDLEVNGANEAFALFLSPVGAGGNTSLLWKVSGGAWALQTCTNTPTGAYFGKLVADPLDPNVMYASWGPRVFRLTRTGSTWDWQDIGDGLPGAPVYDLAGRNIGTPAAPKVLLRAAITTRGVFEADVTSGAVDPPISLYVRDNIADHGWLSPSPDGFPNPFKPSEFLYHYMCADIKIDARQNPAGGGTPFYQTDPEDQPMPPLDHVLFEHLNDHASNLPQTDQAWVHAQVHNRSRTPSGAVQVWAIYCNASAGVPALSTSTSSGNAFPFWDQFTSAGAIVPNLPADSPWTSVGAPVTLTAIDAAHPRVASWNWTIPTLSTGDIGHFCMAVFVHSATSLINEANMSVDFIANNNRQVGQRNLHVGPPLPPSPAPSHEPPGGAPTILEYVEFHNDGGKEETRDLVFDLTRLPPELAVSFRLTPLEAAGGGEPLVRGVAQTRDVTPGEPLSAVRRGGDGSGLLALLRLIWCWLVNLARLLLGRPRRPCRRARVELPKLDPTVYEAKPSARVEVSGVRLSPYGTAAALLTVGNTGVLPPGEVYNFDIQQWSGEEVVGGGRYVVMTEGERKERSKPPLPPTHDPDADPDELERLRKGEGDGERFRYVPPFAKDIVKKREEEQDKREH